MLTVEDLSEFFDQLFDLTRVMPGETCIREAGALLKQIETGPQRFLMQWRAAAVADQYYLRGAKLRHLAERQDVTFQAMSFWLQNHGPAHYLVIWRGDPPGRTFGSKLVIASTLNRVRVAQLRGAGYRIAPATFNVVDASRPGGLAEGAELSTIWTCIEGWEKEQQSGE
jgi:hypothetical protein